MTRNQLFIALAGGAVVLALVSASLTSEESRMFSGGGASIEIENRGDEVIVHTKDGSINCTKNGGTVVIERADGSKTEITCD